ncbi:g4434 [Coccomyxa viridis]|uniref:G4434 protein n=1 Tax=Coccomyxa viridis TaxID=1274662 RepID=A0ABP1FVA9_9CHLO
MNPDDDTARAGTHPHPPSGSEDALKRGDSASPDTLLGPKASESNHQGQGDAPVSGIDDASYMRYKILDVPPWYECILLGFQHYLTMLGSTVLIPFLIVPPMGGTPEDLAAVIGTIFFISGWITLMQTIAGDRLPIIQGGSFAYLTPTAAITMAIKSSREWNDAPDGTNHERFLVTMREVQGGIIASAFFIMFFSVSGLLRAVLRYISPLTVAVNIGIVGLSLYSSGMSGVANCPELGLVMIAFLILFSQFLRGLGLPKRIPVIGGMRIFEMFPVILAIVVVWIYAIILTEAGAYNHASPERQEHCRTDQSSVLHNSPWGRWPYFAQWGAPTFSWSSTFAMLAGAISAMVESIGDYFAAAKICGAPVPPPDVISRAVGFQGFSCVLTGLIGSGNATTAYNENIGCLQLTRVGSRRVVQIGACIAIILSIIGKFGGLFASLPQAMVSGLFCVMFSIIAAIGISQVQFIDLNSPRNIFILGFGLYMSLSVQDYFTSYTAKNNQGPIQTGNEDFNNVFNAIFSTGPAVALIITMVLDNTVPGTIEERGLHVWQHVYKDGEDWWDDDYANRVYGWPFNLTRKFNVFIKPYKVRSAALWARATRCCGRRQHGQHAATARGEGAHV